MDEQLKKLIKPMIILAAIIFACCSLIKKPISLDDYTCYLGYSISVVSVLFFLYERSFWRLIPWNRPPVLKRRYDGTINFHFKGNGEQKKIDIIIHQTLTSVRITTTTDINSSISTVGSFVKENGQDVLYYSYITNPSATIIKKNPIQYGTCRMILDNDTKNLHGNYWTSMQTTGDIRWCSIEEKR